MGMVRISDKVESRLKEVADGRSMNATIEKMLAYCSSPDGFCLAPREGSYTPPFLEKIFERFDELKALIEDTTVDRLASGARVSRTSNPMGEPLDWDVFLYIVFDLCRDDDSPEWVSQSVHDSMDNLNDPITTIILDGYIWAVNDYGKSKLLKVSPRIEEAIREGRRYE